MQKAILDTDILSEYLKGIDENVASMGQRYVQEHGKFTITSVTAYEIVRGLEEKGAPSQVAKALAWISLNEQLVPEAVDYLTAARIKAAGRRQGRVVELPDCLIASVAARLELPLVSGNHSDFEAIRATGLPLILHNWRLAQGE